MARKRKLSGLVLADLHAFSAWGLTPDSFKLSTGSILELNDGQKYLLKCLKHIQKVSPRKLDFLIFNGDLAEGINEKEHGLGVSEPSLLYQARGVVSLIEPFVKRLRKKRGAKYRPIRMQCGSKYHTGEGGAIEELVGKEIDAVPDRFGRHVRPWGKFWIGGVYFDCAHRQSISENQAGVLGKEIDRMLLRFSRQRKKRPEHIVLIRSHTHAGFFCVQRDGITAILTPAFKLQDDFTQLSTSPNRFIPDNIGAVGLEIYPRKQERVKVVKYLYEHPELDDGAEVLI